MMRLMEARPTQPQIPIPLQMARTILLMIPEPPVETRTVTAMAILTCLHL